MKQLAFFLFILLSLLFLLMIIPLFIINPLLYSVEEDAFTAYHTNPRILSTFSGEKSEDISELMQDLLDAPQPVILNIQAKNFEEAERAFEEYKGKSQYFNHIVINFVITESTISEFQRENRRNLASLERILNESAQLDQINQLEIQFQSEDDPALVYSITYEGEALKKAIDKNAKEYLSRESNIIELSSQLDLNSMKFIESAEILQDILRENQEKQETRILNKPTLNVSSISLEVYPNSGHYANTLQVMGAYTFMRIPEVHIALDGQDWKSVVPDQNGIFKAPFTIERIRSGSHFFIANSTSQRSNIAIFSVVPIDTNLTLHNFPGKSWNEINITGFLLADKLPVSNATIKIWVDEFDVLTVETNQEGYYSAIFPVSAGNHTIQSSFDDITFPLNPSFSDIFIINVTPTGTLNWSMSIGLIIILVSMVVSVWYAHRSKQTIASISPEAPLPANFTTSEKSLEKTPFQEDVLAMYQHHFERREWSKAAHLLYRSIIERIEFLSIESDLSTKTPRELLPLLSPLLSGISLQSFVKRYEEIRYGGCRLLEQDPLLLHWIQITSHIMGAGNE